MLAGMEPNDDQPFALNWSRTSPDDGKNEDFTGRDLVAPDIFARIRFDAEHRDRARAWSWSVSVGRVDIDRGHAERVRLAAREAEEAYARWRATKSPPGPKKKPPHLGR